MLNPKTVMQHANGAIGQWRLTNDSPCYIGWLERNVYCCRGNVELPGFHSVSLLSRFKLIEGLTLTEWNNLAQMLIEKYIEIYE